MNISDEVFALTWAADELFAREGIENRLPVIAKIDGPWTRLCAQYSWKEALSLSVQRDEFNLRLAAFDDAILAEVEALDNDQRAVIADDICSGAGWLIEPSVVRETLMEHYRRYAQAFDRQLGFHSDGDISELFTDLEAAGYSFVHLASVNYVDLARVVDQAQYHALTPYGGIDTATISAGPLSAHLRELIANLVSEQGLIVTDDAGLETSEQLDAFLYELSAIPLY